MTRLGAREIDEADAEKGVPMARGFENGGANGSSDGSGEFATVSEIGGKVPKAPEGMRYVGLCRRCRKFVELGPTFTCMNAGHGKDDIAVALLLDRDDPLPELPAMNLGALFMPALWGPAHGQWYMILFYPLWLMLDNLIYGAVHGSFPVWVAVLAGLATAAFTVVYGMRANMHGYLRVAASKTPEEYLAKERRWTVLFVVIAVVFLVFASWYNIAIRPGAAVV